MKYTVQLIATPRKGFDPYGYLISHEGVDVARFWHNYRGECEQLTLIASGHTEDPPFGMCSAFIAGGGPEPHALTDAAATYLDTLISKHTG